MTYEEFLAEQERARNAGDESPGSVAVAEEPAPTPQQFPQQSFGDYALETVGRNAIPFVSGIGNFQTENTYAQARNRLAEAPGDEGAQGIVSSYEARQRQSESQGLPGQIVGGLAGIPALIGESMVGGAALRGLAPAIAQAPGLISRAAYASPRAFGAAVGHVAASTALSPSFFLPQAAQRAAENGGAWYEPQNLGVAGLMGMGQMAILGSLPQVGNGIRGTGAASIAARLGVRTGTGMAEQQIFDAVGGAVDEVLPEAYQTRTRYGILGDAFRGEWGHAWQHLAVQTATFAAFSAMHPGAHGEEPVAPRPPAPEPYGPPRPAELSPQRPIGPGPMAEPNQMPGFMRPFNIPEAQPRTGAISTRMPADVPLPSQVTSRLPAPSSRMPSSDFAPIPLSRGIGVIDSFQIAADALHSQGRSRNEARDILKRATDAVQGELAKKGALSPQEANAFVDGLKLPAAAKAHADSLMEAANRPGVPTHPTAADQLAARGARGGAELNPRPVPPEMLPRSPLGGRGDASRTSNFPFRAEPRGGIDPRDVTGAAMRAAGRPSVVPEPAPPPVVPPAGGRSLPIVPVRPGAERTFPTPSSRPAGIGFNEVTRPRMPNVEGGPQLPVPGRDPSRPSNFPFRRPGPPAAPPVRPEPPKAPVAPVKGLEAAQKAPKGAKAPRTAAPPEFARKVESLLAEHLNHQRDNPGEPPSRDVIDRLQELAPDLTNEQAEVLLKRFRPGGPSQPEVAAEMGITRQAVQDLEVKAVRNLGLENTVAKALAISAEGERQGQIKAGPETTGIAGRGGARDTPADRLNEAIIRVTEQAKRGELTPEQLQAAQEVYFAIDKDIQNAKSEAARQGHSAASIEAALRTAIEEAASRSGVPVSQSAASETGQPTKGTKGLAPDARVPGTTAKRSLSTAEPPAGPRGEGMGRERWSEPHNDLHSKLTKNLETSGMNPEKQFRYADNSKAVLSHYNTKAVGVMQKNLKETNWHGSTRELTDNLAKIDRDVAAMREEGKQAGGAYDRQTGTMDVDGDAPDGGRNGREILAHEFGHALDGPTEVYSSSRGWQAAHAAEARGLGEYAMTQAKESFAEFSRLVGTGASIEALRAEHPQMTAFWEKNGLLSDRAASEYRPLKQIFDQAIDNGNLHTDILKGRSFYEIPPDKAEKAGEWAAESTAPKGFGAAVGKVKDKSGRLVTAIRDSFRYGLDHLNQLSGQAFINATRASQALGEKMGRFVATRTWVAQAVPDIIDRVVGERATERFRHEAGAAIMEMSIREYQAKLRAEGTPSAIAKADKMRTFVKDRVNSTTNAVFESDAAYERFINSPEGKRLVNAYKEHVTPELQEFWRHYKSGEGELTMEGDSMEGIAQMKDMPINFMRIEEGDINSPFYVGGGRGKLKNPQDQKLLFDQNATRAHPQYETDISKIIENSFNHSAGVANKRAMYNQAIGDGLAQRGPAGGARGTLPNGDKVVEFPRVYRNGDSLYVSERVGPELRQALAVDSPANIPFVSDAAKVLNRAMGAALAEPVSHTKNILTSLIQAGVNPIEMIPNVVRVMRNSIETRKTILELAKINAFRGGHGLESGQLWGGKYDPTHWVGKVINVVDAAARLTLKSGYERLVRRGATEASETGLRDYVNQGLGDYNKLSQHKLVVLLRDLGIGPFATAGTKFYTAGMRLLTLQPNAKPTTAAQGLMMRAEILAKLVGTLAAVTIANKMLWKNLFGDDDTPLGAIKTGKTADGKTTYFDLTAFTGLTRGMRQSGLLALSEGLRQGTSPQRIFDRGWEATYTAMLHPAEGPVVNFLHTLATGRDTFGRDVIPPESAGGSRALESVRAAFIGANPFTESLFAHDKKAADMTYGARVLDLLGPFNPFKERGDQALGELRGRTRELEDQRRAFYTRPENISRAFPREAEYRVLNRFNDAVVKLNNVISGTVSTQQGRRAIARPEAERIQQLRKQVTDLAQQAMQTQNRYRVPS